MMEQLRASPSLFPRRLCLVWEGKVLSGEDPLPAQASERCLNRALRAPSASLPRGLFPPSCTPGEAFWVKAIISRKFLLIACSRLMGPYHITAFSGMNHTGCLKLGPQVISIQFLFPFYHLFVTSHLDCFKYFFSTACQTWVLSLQPSSPTSVVSRPVPLVLRNLF